MCGGKIFGIQKVAILTQTFRNYPGGMRKMGRIGRKYEEEKGIQKCSLDVVPMTK
jgi:hypothetical protein